MEKEKAAEKLYGIINYFLFNERKKPLVFEGVELYPSEIHMMLEIRDGELVNATKAADQFGITKGAVSQTLKRLEKKGILIKNKDPYHKNELSVTLTTMGKRAYGAVQGVRDGIMGKFQRVLDDFTEPDQAVIARFLSDLNDTLRAE